MSRIQYGLQIRGILLTAPVHREQATSVNSIFDLYFVKIQKIIVCLFNFYTCRFYEKQKGKQSYSCPHYTVPTPIVDKWNMQQTKYIGIVIFKMLNTYIFLENAKHNYRIFTQKTKNKKIYNQKLEHSCAPSLKISFEHVKAY